MNRDIHRKSMLLCVVMIIAGICLFINAVLGISSYWSRGESERNNQNAGAGAGQVISAEAAETTDDDMEISSVQDALSAGGGLDLTESSGKIKYIQSHTDDYPEGLLDLLSRNVETVDFVYSYPELVKQGLNTEEAAWEASLTEDELTSAHPLFLQWDNRWGAVPYGTSMMALSGCGPTCLSMAAVALTGNAEATPAAVAMYAMENGFYTEGAGTAWSLMTDGCTAYGLQAQDISVSEEQMVEKLEAGCMLICSVSPGDFTQTGHFIVIYGYDDGWFEVNDPNSVSNSQAKWKFDRLEGQIRSMWALSAM
ncbi:MAG: C39 family peptidase [Lachnospiraceae bacterium]|nr:C39 family peptidase [Lachnospiraceae bacterium]